MRLSVAADAIDLITGINWLKVYQQDNNCGLQRYYKTLRLKH